MQIVNNKPFIYYDLSWIHSFSTSSTFRFDLGYLDDNLKNEKITKNVIYTENSQYTILRYNKNILNYDLADTYGLLRSVILDKNDNIVSFSPPKSMATEFFIQKYKSFNEPYIVAEEFIEGTMINLFWDETIGLSGDWEIATRNNVGGNLSFYQSCYNKYGVKNKTFRQMFLEAMNECQLTFDHLTKGYTYSFVLQHPENRIVIPFKKPNLYLIAIYYCVDDRKKQFLRICTCKPPICGKINNDKINPLPKVVKVCECLTNIHEKPNIFVYPIDMNSFYENSPIKNTLVQFPKSYQENSYSALIKKYASMNTPYDIMGIVIYNQLTKERCKIRNPVYEQVRQLKGNHPKLQYLYLSLRHCGKINEYLSFYPEHKKEFSVFRDDVHLFTKTLYDNYVECFMKKKIDISKYPYQYQSHMIELHKRFINELRENKLRIDHNYVIEYINELPPAKLMFSINYHLRKRNVEMQIP